jgi:putative endonuclease
VSFSRVAAARRIPLFRLRRINALSDVSRVHQEQSLKDTLHWVTNDLERRVFEHKEGNPGSFTARYNVNRLVYFEEFGDVTQAIDREKEIKRNTRRQKIKLIESMNPEWRDLSPPE